MDLHPLNTAHVIECSIWDGSAFVAGLTPVLTIVRASDGYYWTGAAWQAGDATVNMTEHAAFTGRYTYTLSAAAIGSTPNAYLWEMASAPHYRRDAFQTRLPEDVASLDTELHLVKAVVCNKKVKNLETGVTAVKDDDGTTTLLTLTPSVAGSEFTVTPT